MDEPCFRAWRGVDRSAVGGGASRDVQESAVRSGHQAGVGKIDR